MDSASFRPYTIGRPLHTERLTLRLMTTADIDDAFAYHPATTYAAICCSTADRAEVAAKVAEFAAANTLATYGDVLQLALELPAADGYRPRVIGDSYFAIASTEHSRDEIGWTMHPDYVGRGYASEAASAVLRLAFRELVLHKVFAELDPRNDASVGLCLRLGMREAH